MYTADNCPFTRTILNVLHGMYKKSLSFVPSSLPSIFEEFLDKEGLKCVI